MGDAMPRGILTRLCWPECHSIPYCVAIAHYDFPKDPLHMRDDNGLGVFVDPPFRSDQAIQCSRLSLRINLKCSTEKENYSMYFAL